ncbi:CPBP family intramembrane metalloprotease [Halobacteriales archaeon QS_7_68_65]|nr:MAG: CPBP family intramembrane metalloprotease [Halobacteriales archaeon QS_7_68_65]
MPRWAVFAGVTALVLVLLLALARASQLTVDGSVSSAVGADSHRPTDHGSHDGSTDPGSNGGATESIESSTAQFDAPTRPGALSPGALLANVALSQGLFAIVLLAGAWYAEIPPAALGVSAAPLSTGPPALGVGIAVGLGLYLVNELGTLGANAAGIETPDALRELLTPDSRSGWLILLVGVLPTIAVFEELLFRAALIGALAAGFPISPWLLAALSSIAFALGHGAQGTVGMVATGGLGFVLAGTFVVTGSLLVVVVAHYLVNALEFVVHEGLGVEFALGD